MSTSATLRKELARLQRAEKLADKASMEKLRVKMAFDPLIREAKKQLVLEEGHLSRLQWEAHIYGQGQICIQCHLEQKDPLRALVDHRGFGGGSIALGNGVTVSISDNTASIGFDKPESITSFVMNRKIKVTAPRLGKEIVELREKADALERLTRLFPTADAPKR